MTFRSLVAPLAIALAALLSAPPATAQEKVLRYAFPIAETGLDPAQINDLYSSILLSHIFDSPLTYDYLARRDCSVTSSSDRAVLPISPTATVMAASP